MNLKDLFIRKKEKEELDIPKVNFEDLELQVTIGQWLGVLPSQKIYENSEVRLYRRFSANELITRKKISTKDLEKVSQKFGEVLKLIDVDKTETCVLSEYNKDNFSFNCHLVNANADALFSLRWGTMVDNGPELIVEFQNIRKTYEYYDEHNYESTHLRLEEYTVKNNNNGNVYRRYLMPFMSSFNLNNGEYRLIIQISAPKSVENSSIFSPAYRLQNEKKFEKYLLNLSFPIAIDEIYKKFCNLSLDDVCEYPSIEIQVVKKKNDKKDIITDYISMQDGNLSKFIITRNGKTIFLDKTGQWSYQSEKVSVNKDNGLNVNFSLKSENSNQPIGSVLEYQEMNAITEEVNNVKEEVENVKKLARTIFKK